MNQNTFYWLVNSFLQPSSEYNVWKEIPCISFLPILYKYKHISEEEISILKICIIRLSRAQVGGVYILR